MTGGRGHARVRVRWHAWVTQTCLAGERAWSLLSCWVFFASLVWSLSSLVLPFLVPAALCACQESQRCPVHWGNTACWGGQYYEVMPHSSM